MEKETKEYLDRKFLGLVTRDDVEKLRQEVKANFRQVKEESRAQIQEGRQETKSDIEQLRKEWAAEIIPFRGEMRDGLRKFDGETQSALEHSNQVIESSLRRVREEMGVILDQMRQEINPILQSMKRGEGDSLLASQQEVRKDIHGLRKGMDQFEEHIKEISKDLAGLNGVAIKGLTEVKEELGAMMKFSYADLEKKISTLEARIKALEKLAFH